MRACEHHVVVTGAFGYTGRYITRRLLSIGKSIITLTGHPHRRNPFGNRVRVEPFNFNDPRALVDSMRGATELYNTYWVRFAHGGVTFDQAVENTKILVSAAEEAGIRRLVHISVTNACADSALPYFRGKGIVERAIAKSALSHAILRPTLIYGHGDILINNIAWLVRRSPIFAVPGPGDYRLQPVYVEDLARLAVDAGHTDENVIIDTVGPDTYTFDELVRLIAKCVGSRAGIIHVRPAIALGVSRLIGRVVRDVILTRDEMAGLMQNLLVSDEPPRGRTRLSEWLAQHAATVGVRYASELARHYR